MAVAVNFRTDFSAGDLRRLHPALGLVDLEAAEAGGARRVRGPAEEAGEAADDMEVGVLRLLAQAAHGHIFEHAAARRRDRSYRGVGWTSHRHRAEG